MDLKHCGVIYPGIQWPPRTVYVDARSKFQCVGWVERQRNPPFKAEDDGFRAAQPILLARLHCFGARRPYQYLGRNAELVVQTADHVDRQASAAVEHLRNPGARTEDPLQILAGKALLLHPEFDRLDRSGGSIGWCALSNASIRVANTSSRSPSGVPERAPHSRSTSVSAFS